MNPTAKAHWMGLERSNGFIEFFTAGMEGADWLQRPAGAPNPAIWILGHLAHSRAAFLEMLTGQQMYEEGWEAKNRRGQILPFDIIGHCLCSGHVHIP